MSKPGTPLRVILGPDVVPHVDGDARTGIVLHRHNPQTVSERSLFNIKWDNPYLGHGCDSPKYEN